MPGLIDIGAMIRGIFSGVLKMYTPKGFFSPNNPPNQTEWIKELTVDQENQTVRIVIECSTLEAAWWAMLNTRPCMDGLLDVQDGKDLLFADKVPDNPND